MKTSLNTLIANFLEMAGYLFSLDSNESLISSIQKGVYSTRIKDPSNGIWRINVEGTFADYCSMREGDNVYFFIKEKFME